MDVKRSNAKVALKGRIQTLMGEVKKLNVEGFWDIDEIISQQNQILAIIAEHWPTCCSPEITKFKSIISAMILRYKEIKRFDDVIDEYVSKLVSHIREILLLTTIEEPKKTIRPMIMRHESFFDAKTSSANNSINSSANNSINSSANNSINSSYHNSPQDECEIITSSIASPRAPQSRDISPIVIPIPVSVPIISARSSSKNHFQSAPDLGTLSKAIGEISAESLNNFSTTNNLNADSVGSQTSRARISQKTSNRNSAKKVSSKITSVGKTDYETISQKKFSTSSIPPAEINNTDYLYWKSRSEMLEKRLNDMVNEINESSESLRSNIGVKKLTSIKSKNSDGEETKTYLPVVLNSKTQFAIEPEIECEMNIELNIKEDVYPKYFNNNNSEIYIYSSENNKGESFIVMVNKSDISEASYNCLEITKKGQLVFTIEDNEDNIKLFEKGLGAKLSKILTSHYVTGKPMNRIRSIEAKQKIIKIQEEFPTILKSFQIAVIYAKLGQVDPHEMFKNKSSESFNKFLSSVLEISSTEKEKNKLVNWKHFQLTYHISTQQNSDEHRRDTGNCPSFIFFKEEGEQFDSSEIGKLGMIPQIFLVVQPCSSGYRVGSFMGYMNSFTPTLCANFVFKNNQQLKEFLLTKIHNGLIELVFNTSPMNRSYILKRQEAIDTIVNSSK